MSRSICFIFLDLNGGGIERTMLVLAEEFARRGYRSDLVVLRSRGAFLNEVPDNVNLIQLDVKGMRASHLRGVFAFAKYLRARKPDGIISAGPMFNLMAIWGRRFANGKMRLVTTDRNDPRRAHFKNGIIKGRLTGLLTRKSYKMADVNSSVSTGVTEELARHLGVPPDSLTTVYNPKDIEASGAKTPPSHPWLLDKNGFQVIVAAGRFTEQKNFPNLIDAFCDIAAHNDNIRMIIFGEGTLRNEFQAQIDTSGFGNRIDLPGFTLTIRSEFAACDLFVMSSSWEGLPNVLIEALAEGTPVVSTDCPFGAREILLDGKLGALVPIEDRKALGDAMAAVLADPPPPCPMEDLERFSIKGSADAYEALLFDTPYLSDPA